jgi:hypothetical protein
MRPWLKSGTRRTEHRVRRDVLLWLLEALGVGDSPAPSEDRVERAKLTWVSNYQAAPSRLDTLDSIIRHCFRGRIHWDGDAECGALAGRA